MTKHIGLDIHQATISAAILDGTGKLLMECIVETRAATILSLSMDFAEACTSLLKKVPGLLGCMTC